MDSVERSEEVQEKISGRHCHIVRSNLSESVYSARECFTGLCAIRSGGNMCAEYVVSIRKVRHGHGHAELHAADDDGADDDGPDVLRAADADDLRGGQD